MASASGPSNWMGLEMGWEGRAVREPMKNARSRETKLDAPVVTIRVHQLPLLSVIFEGCEGLALWERSDTK